MSKATDIKSVKIKIKSSMVKLNVFPILPIKFSSTDIAEKEIKNIMPIVPSLS